jgi:hypothetical protein
MKKIIATLLIVSCLFVPVFADEGITLTQAQKDTLVSMRVVEKYVGASWDTVEKDLNSETPTEIQINLLNQMKPVLIGANIQVAKMVLKPFVEEVIKKVLTSELQENLYPSPPSIQHGAMIDIEYVSSGLIYTDEKGNRVQWDADTDTIKIIK